MSSYNLIKEFGGDVTFYGGIDVQELLPFGTTDQVRAAVRRAILAFRNKGGYILASAHTLLPDIPIRNIKAMYEEAINITNTEN